MIMLHEVIRARPERVALPELFDEPAHYNAAPEQDLPITISEEPGAIRLGRWGFIPSSAKEAKPRIHINARSETVDTRPAFRDSFLKRRCIVYADGFYEWMKTENGKIPHRICLREEDIFAFAGIFDRRGDQLRYAILTTAPNELMAPIHDRMPVILTEAGEEQWLDRDEPAQKAKKLLVSYPANQMTAYAVSNLVNNYRNDSPEVIEPLDPSAPPADEPPKPPCPATRKRKKSSAPGLFD